MVETNGFLARVPEAFARDVHQRRSPETFTRDVHQNSLTSATSSVETGQRFTKTVFSKQELKNRSMAEFTFY